MQVAWLISPGNPNFAQSHSEHLYHLFFGESMTFLKSISIMLVAAVSLLLVGCNENDPLNPTTDAPNAPTALMLQSRDGALGMMWTAPVTGVTPTGYRVMYRAGSTGSYTAKDFAGTATSAVLTGLTNGTVYEVMVHALNGTEESPASSIVMWAPAARTTTTLRLYSSTNSTQGSGASIWPATGAPSVLRIAQGGEWDICFDDKDANADDPRIASPGQSLYVNNDFEFPNGSTAKTTYFGKELTNIASLDDIYETSAFLSQLPGDDSPEKSYRISTIGGSKNWGSVVASKIDNTTFRFGRVMMIRGVDGKFVQGSGTGQYIDIMVSYQVINNVPYALKQRLEQVISQQTRGQRTNN
jgi:hypothetical protein